MTMLERFVPNPVLSLAIVALWMALAQSLDLGNLLLALVVALIIPIATREFWADRPRFRNVLKAPLLFGRVVCDIVLANIEVARLVVGPLDKLSPAFIEVPLDAKDPFVATLLGSIITLTPGTVTIDIDRDRNIILVHALNVADEGALIAEIKRRYEKPLMEIFKC
jgi:multicomponent K+:H+ antiporter subunit E